MKKNEIQTFTSSNFENLVLSATESEFTLGEKVVKDKALTTYHARASVLVTAKSISDKALCIECGRVNPSDVEKIGYSSVSAFINDCFGNALDSNTINRYIRVGKVFGDYTADGYKWKAPISQAVSVTNLGQIIAMVFEDLPKDKKDIYKLSEKELNDLFDEFVEKYRPDEDGGLPLQGTNKALRKYLNDLKAKAEEIPTTAEEVTETTETETAETETETAEKVDGVEVMKEKWTLTLHEIMGVNMGNKDIESHVLALLELLEVV